jgi:hypothetical protein
MELDNSIDFDTSKKLYIIVNSVREKDLNKDE